jgi:hypothetical protein
MAIFVVLSTCLDRTLLTIQSSVCLLALYQAGVRSNNLFLYLLNSKCLQSVSSTRCTTLATDLDGDFVNSVERSHEHTEALFQAYDNDMKQLWDGYGIIGDVTVCTIFQYFKAFKLNYYYFFRLPL